MDGSPTAGSQLVRWGGVAGVVGFGLLLGSVIAVGAFGLPDASDVETLTDFPDLETGRIVEHFLYLGAVVAFALHLSVLQRLLAPDHPPAALFGAVTAGFGYVIMAGSAVLHVSTSPLSELYLEPDATTGDRAAIEYSWSGAQSVFDTMLTTGVLLVSVGIVFLGLAMQSGSTFGSRLTALTLGLGVVGTAGAVVAVIDPGSMLLALSVLAVAVFAASTGWRMRSDTR
ncbi:MAG: hypothetical protein AAGK32_17315 [Actinomycetota bacterium]